MVSPLPGAYDGTGLTATLLGEGNSTVLRGSPGNLLLLVLAVRSTPGSRTQQGAVVGRWAGQCWDDAVAESFFAAIKTGILLGQVQARSSARASRLVHCSAVPVIAGYSSVKLVQSTSQDSTVSAVKVSASVPSSGLIS